LLKKRKQCRPCINRLHATTRNNTKTFHIKKSGKRARNGECNQGWDKREGCLIALERTRSKELDLLDCNKRMCSTGNRCNKRTDIFRKGTKQVETRRTTSNFEGLGGKKLTIKFTRKIRFENTFQSHS